MTGCESVEYHSFVCYEACCKQASIYFLRNIVMNLVTISDELLQKYREQDKEVLQEHDRPYMLLVRLKYKGKKFVFYGY